MPMPKITILAALVAAIQGFIVRDQTIKSLQDQNSALSLHIADLNTQLSTLHTAVSENDGNSEKLNAALQASVVAQKAAQDQLADLQGKLAILQDEHDQNQAKADELIKQINGDVTNPVSVSPDGVVTVDAAAPTSPPPTSPPPANPVVSTAPPVVVAKPDLDPADIEPQQAKTADAAPVIPANEIPAASTDVSSPS